MTRALRVLAVAGFLGLAVLWWVHVQRFDASALHTAGTVIPGSISGSGGTRHPTVEFDIAGKRHQVYIRDSWGGRRFVVGETVPLLVPADSPEDATVDQPMRTWIPIGVCGFAAFLAAAARRGPPGAAEGRRS